MNIISKRNFLLLIASVLVVGFGIMSVVLFNKRAAMKVPQFTIQNVDKPMTNSDNIDDIQKDFDNTDIKSVDKDLQDLEKELNQIN